MRTKQPAPQLTTLVTQSLTLKASHSMPQAAETEFSFQERNWTIKRFPFRKHDTLRAWDAADELLLQEVAGNIGMEQSVLILNDGFGALGTILGNHQTHWVNDSFISEQACRQNLLENGKDTSQLNWHNSLDWPDIKFDWVIIKLPKSHAQLEDQLYRLKSCLHSDSKIIAAAMTKNLHSQTIKLFEKLIGKSHTSLARKKARLLFAKAEHLEATPSPYPKQYSLDEYDLKAFNHAAVFSQQKLDIGTAFLLEHFPKLESCERIIDLGCGNGLLGLRAAQLYPEANIEFYDESYSAIASARLNAEKNQLASERLHFFHGDCLDQAATNSADLIVNNPPFHQQHSISSHIAKQMFRQSWKALRKGGELWVVANRHLGYHKDLQTIFGNQKVVQSNNKFVILRARKNR